MRQSEKCLRFGIGVVLCAMVLRLASGGAVDTFRRWLETPRAQSLLIYLETGQRVRSSSLVEAVVLAPESAPPLTLDVSRQQTQVQADPQPQEVFTRADAQSIRLYNTSGLTVDVEELLLSGGEFPEGEGAKVLLYSTHTTESYTASSGQYVQTAAYRTLDSGYNMLSLGEALENLLLQLGVPTVRDETLHDYPSYNAAYTHARKSVKQFLSREPGLCLVLDLHRDAADTSTGQLRTLAQVDGEQSAQLMLVVGSNASGLTHPDWQSNLALALKLQVLLERLSPGITRPICLRSQRFNQDLSSGSLLIEIGAAGNTRQEAMATLPILAEAIRQLLEY